MISAIKAESGTTIEIGRNMLFKLSGSSVLPAYPSKIKINHETLRLLYKIAKDFQHINTCFVVWLSLHLNY